MNDKEYRKQRKRVKDLVKKWHHKLGMSWWKVDYVYERDTKKERNTNYDCANIDSEVVADTTTDFWYGWATITFYLPVVSGRTDDELEEDLLHEYMHVFVKPLQDENRSKEEELVVTRLARAFIWSKS